MSQSLLDTVYAIEIPGGIELDAQVVGPIPRIHAFVIDLFIRGLIILLLSIALMPFGLAGSGFILIFFFIIEWFYPVLFEVFRSGQTPGKKINKIAVVHDDLTPVTFGSSLLRNLLRVVDFLPFLYILGLVTMLLNGRFQRLGDLAAGTMVISVKEFEKPAIKESIEPLAPRMSLNREEQTVIIEFLHRSSRLSHSRKTELAEILDDVVSESDGDKVDTLHRIGVWYLGVR